MKTFWAIDPRDEQGKVLLELNSATPRDAALKMATRDEHLICIAEAATGKLHIFSGTRVPLTEEQHNEFTRQRNITCKPSVSKLAYKAVGQSLSKRDLQMVRDTFVAMMG